MSGRAGATWSGRPQGPQRAPPPPRATTPRGYRPPRRYRRPAGTAGPPEAGRPLVQGQACPSRSPCASSWVTRPKQVSRRGAACGRPRRGQASRQGVGGSVLARRLLVSARFAPRHRAEREALLCVPHADTVPHDPGPGWPEGPWASAGGLLLLLGGLRRLATAFRVQLLPHDLGVQDRDTGRSWRFSDARDGNGFNEARVRPRHSGPTHSRRRREAKFARQEADAGRHFCPSTGRGAETRGPTARRPAPGPLPGSAASRLRTRAP